MVHKYVVKWQHIEDPKKKWRDFVKPAIFKSLSKAQDFAEEEQTDFAVTRVFESKK